MQHSFGYNRFMLVSGILIFGDNASAQNNIDSQMPNIIWITS
jgi:hypothetical protein